MPHTAPSTPDDMEMDALPTSSTHPYAPPPHIAARFYRKSSNRRKSSAHSSRRSSLSSLSHHSTLSCHGGPQSTHIAQHLRRASIIESRKARLADRAAHAEQVRLRAALAKSQPRVSYSEERAIAAQAAREKLLAEIAARCEAEVRRAKKIAEETKEKKAAEHARLEQELAEKFAEAARRRSIYQHNARRPRTMSLAAVEEKKVSPSTLRRLSEKAAAKVIQRVWRDYRQKRAISNFLNIGIHSTRIRNFSFEDLTKSIAEEHIMSCSAAMLQALGLLDGNTDEFGEKGAVRVFLSAYLILAHPAQALSHGGQDPQEQDLLQKGKALLETLESFLHKVHSSRRGVQKSKEELDKLSFLFTEFSSTFHTWRGQDLTVIIDVMVSSFVNLDLILQSTKHDRDGHVAEDYYHAVRQEQIKLLARLKKLAGPDEALSRVRMAVRKARKQRALQEHRGSDTHVPRTSSFNGSAESSQNLTRQMPTPPTTPEPGRVRPVQPSFASQLGRMLTLLPSNREIAHEMQMNGIFEVQQQPWTNFRKQFIDSMRDGMRRSMESGNKEVMAEWTHATAVLIREKLLNLVRQRHPLYDRIDGLLDTKLIDQQIQNGMFSYNAFFEQIAKLIAQICSPGRDQLVKDFAEDVESDTIDRLFSLISIVDLMTLDHINFQFRIAASHVIEHGHEHEHGCFEKDLADGVHNLERTRSWWRNARLSISPTSELSPQIPGHVIYARAITDLVLSNTHLNYTAVPETLQLDWIRLLHLRARALHLVATSSILLTTKIRLRRNRESLWTRDAERLLALDLSTSSKELTDRIVNLIESSHNMPDSTREGLTDFVKRVTPPAIAAIRNAHQAEEAKQTAMQMQDATYDPASTHLDTADVLTEQVTMYHLKSLREHVFARLAAVSTAEKLRVTTSAAEVLARAGMPEFVSHITAISDLLEKVRAVDLRAHGSWLDRIASEIESEGTLQQ